MLFKAYYRLAKPGIIYGNMITAAGGFFLASAGSFNVLLFVAMLVGISLVMASACVFNNYIDRDIDRLMARTNKRALVSGEISERNALIYAVVLGLIGFFVLTWYTNLTATYVALGGFIAYVILYGIGKRRTVHGTVIGSVSGAVPPVVGYTAVSGAIDAAAGLLFFILVLWQMPHFYAIAMYRIKDYTAASIPVLPIKKGSRHTKIQMVVYVILFVLATICLTLIGYTGYIYAVVMTVLGIMWLKFAFEGFDAPNESLWARRFFKFSLIVLLAFSVLISLDMFLL